MANDRRRFLVGAGFAGLAALVNPGEAWACWRRRRVVARCAPAPWPYSPYPAPYALVPGGTAPIAVSAPSQGAAMPHGGIATGGPSRQIPMCTGAQTIPPPDGNYKVPSPGSGYSLTLQATGLNGYNINTSNYAFRVAEMECGTVSPSVNVNSATNNNGSLSMNCTLHLSGTPCGRGNGNLVYTLTFVSPRCFIAWSQEVNYS